jgi:hypothetical protein
MRSVHFITGALLSFSVSSGDHNTPSPPPPPPPSIPPSIERLLFTTTSPGSSTWSNPFAGWFSAGSTVLSGDGKRDAYDTVTATMFKFEIGGETATFSVPTPTTMLNIVHYADLTSSSWNSGSTTWNNGHASYTFDSRSSTTYFPSSTLRIGVGDGGYDTWDWALFMFESGNSGGDFEGNSARALGSESYTYTYYYDCSGCTISIYAFEYIVPPASPSPPLPPAPPMLPPTPPTPPPPPPPWWMPTATTIITTAVVAAGDVSDFTLDVQLGLRERVAWEVGVATSAVTLTISEASVLLTFQIAVSTPGDADAATAVLSEKLTDEHSATLFLAVPVMSIETMPTALDVFPPAPPGQLNQSPSAPFPFPTWLIGPVCAGVFAVLLICRIQAAKVRRQQMASRGLRPTGQSSAAVAHCSTTSSSSSSSSSSQAWAVPVDPPMRPSQVVTTTTTAVVGVPMPMNGMPANAGWGGYGSMGQPVHAIAVPVGEAEMGQLPVALGYQVQAM